MRNDPKEPINQTKTDPNPNRWLFLLLVLMVGYLIFQNITWENAENYRPRPVTARGDLAASEKATIELFDAASPSVVYITTIALKTDYFRLNVYRIPEGTGSGFVWSQDGYIVTNFHVLQKAQEAEVMLSDHSTWKAKLVGVAPDKDLAVLKIDAPKSRLHPIPIGTSSDLKVGQKVFAIGNPFGLDHTLTTGVISGLGREIQSVTKRPIQDVIQTDAAINPGNSGGPLLDSAGRLIGVNTAIFSPSGAYAGIGFAVPVDTVNRVIPQLVEKGRLPKAGLGVQIAQDHISRRFAPRGVLVVRVVPGGPADQAGIQPTKRKNGRIIPGDIILGIDGKEIQDSNDLFRILDGYQIGDKIEVLLRHNGEIIKKQVTLGELPE